MKTMNDINTMIQAEGAPAYRAYRDSLKAARDTLEAIHGEHYTTNDTPAQTVEKYVAAVGYDLAAVVVASLVNRSAWDGRISNEAKAWAATIADALDEDAANRIGMYAKIHMVHLDQIACAFAKFERPTDPTPTDPTPDDTTDPTPDETNETTGSGSTWAPAVGDVVRVSGGYHANSNGLFVIEGESGRGWWLKPITKAGKLRKASGQSWPLVSYVSDPWKSREAREHNKKHAKMEPAPEVPTCYVAEFFRANAAELAKRAEEQAARGYAWANETRAAAEKAAQVAARFDPADVPPEEKKAPALRIYWNGLKINGGDLVKFHLSPNDGGGVTLYGDGYRDLPREYFEVVNNSDSMSDYFENDSATVDPAHPLYRFLRFVALKRIATGHSYSKMTPAQAAEWAGMKDPGQPTDADAEAARAWIVAERERAEQVRKAAEAEARAQDERRCQYQRTEGGRLIRETAAAYPIREGAPYVLIRWSEHPAFYDWDDDTLTLSIAAADLIFKRLDDEQHTARENGGDQFGPCQWCYFKTKFQIHYTDPETGEPQIFEDRYDLGDGLGGLVAFYVGANPDGHPFSEMLLDNQAGGRVVSITVAPWVKTAMHRKAQRAARETSEIFAMAEMLTVEQLEAAILRLDNTDPENESIAQFFAQELMRRDQKKAVEVWRRWKSGETE